MSAALPSKNSGPTFGPDQRLEPGSCAPRLGRGCSSDVHEFTHQRTATPTFARQNARPDRAVSTSCFEVTPASGAVWDVAAPGTAYGPGVGEGEGVGDGVGEGLVGDGDATGVTFETDVWYAPAAR